MSDLREKRVELILQQLEQLPTLPAVTLRVLEVTGDDDSSAQQVVELIQADQSLAARVLQLVHRADTGVRGEINSIERAVVLLGFEAVRAAALAIGVFETFSATEGGATFSREEFWKHSIAVACCAELLAEAVKVEGVDPAEAFVCGLLHDFGKVALDAVLPKSFSRVVEAADLLRMNIADLERSIIGLDHMVVGKRLAERWQLPVAIRDCVWLHGQLPAALPSSVKHPTLVNLVTLADILVREQHLGYSGNYAFTVSRQPLVEALRLSDEALAAVLTKLVDHIGPRAQALGLGKASSGELYQQALAQANKELGRVGTQLATRNRKLAIRAKFFDALSQFHSELRPDAPVQTVLQAIGQTAVGVLEVGAVGAFSLGPTATFAEIQLFDSAGEPFETSLIDCPDRPSRPAAGEGPVLAAGDELEWLLGAISPRLRGDKRYWMCLEADGICIGGVVWGAPAGEAQRLSPQVQELSAIAGGWSLALRTAQIREEAQNLAEQLAEANRQLQSAQSEILRSKMMITVGEMAAGAAHEMNNPLAVISGRSQLLSQQLSDPKHQAIARLIAEQADRLSHIITELMDFAKPTPPKIAEADLSDLIEHALHDAKQHTDPVDRKIEITMGEIPPVMIDVEQVRAAMTEILGNALQATDENTGTIDIHAAYDAFSGKVVVTVTDNGCGMDEHTLKRAFDPFFSSKRAGRRRGMGLAKALRWIETQGGSIRLESRPGQGTRAILLLPAVTGGQAASVTNKKTAT
jgi:putative nucleotidyltransferase with HDIG domain